MGPRARHCEAWCHAGDVRVLCCSRAQGSIERRRKLHQEAVGRGKKEKKKKMKKKEKKKKKQKTKFETGTKHKYCPPSLAQKPIFF